MGNGYEIVPSSSHQISIVGEEPVNDDNEAIVNYFYVEPKVKDIWWNAAYIVAKQLHLQPNENGTMQPPENPSKADWSYWVIEIDQHLVTGPLTYNELEQFAKRLELEIKFLSIERLRKIYKNV